MPIYLRDTTPSLEQLEQLAAESGAGWIQWSVEIAPNAHLKACAERLAAGHLEAANILSEMKMDPEAPRHRK
jgi:hypothetical protein